MRPNLRSLLLNIGKVALALGLILWMTNSGRLNFKSLDIFWHSPEVLLWGLIHFFGCTLLLGSCRWHLLLTLQNIHPSFRTTATVTSIGLFFNASMPGAVGGDVIKSFYMIRDQRSSSKTSIIAAVFADRLLGLTGLFAVSSAAIFLSAEKVSSFNNLGPLITFTFAGGFLLISALLVSLYAPEIWLSALKKRLQKKQHKPAEIATKLLHTADLFRKSPGTILICWTISIIIQLIVIVYYAHITQFITQQDVSYSMLGAIIPLATITTTLPISPAGLGIGHVAFQTLFHYIGIQQGADIFNIQIIGFLALSLSGVVPYLSRRQTNSTSLVNMEQETCL